jgi:aminoglycoside 6'-N-acetyltransferase I
MKENFAFTIRRITAGDADNWTRLRCELWPDGQQDHAPEIASFFAGALPDVAEVLAAETSEGEMIAFAELSIRTDLPSLVGRKIGYVEGLYVIPEARGSGVTWALLLASRQWARQQRCEGLASDRADRVIIDKRYSGVPLPDLP